MHMHTQQAFNRMILRHFRVISNYNVVDRIESSLPDAWIKLLVFIKFRIE